MLSCASFALLAFVLGSGVSCVGGLRRSRTIVSASRGRFANAVRSFNGNYCIHRMLDGACLKCAHFQPILRAT
ncbi:RxLR-like protein [Plasmopara halstedii]|uniref:RxLR-like protein n=1 Tax=Plasmopara halstedii TaxID=4781 RepID=A0A0N7L5K5_PLAHL|nr:RxLR-like protein [Plasmopara halstedii]CEG41731.1 RxLR-like protein [Plasmopara halstedii]|eukprot:XP_024578100.1 RxLR-like protein [Plasmopara halstedii]